MTRPTFLRGALLAAPLLTLSLAGCEAEQPQPDLDSEVALRSFESCEQLRDYTEDVVLEHLVQARYSYWGFGVAEDGATADAGDSGGDEGSPDDYTTTNVQEEGVDEVDIVKTDGNFIYAVEDDELHIVDSWPVESAEKIASVQLDGWARGLFLYEDTLAVFSYFQDEDGFTDRYWGGTRISLIDISDRANPEVTRELDFEGWMADGRLIDDDAYVVLNTWLPLPQEAWELVWDDDLDLPEMDWDASEEEMEAIREEARQILEPHVDALVADLDLAELLPKYRSQAPDADVEPEQLHACTDIYRPAETAQFSMTSVLRLDVDDAELEPTGIMSDGWTVYASADNLYVAQSSWWWWWGWGDVDFDTHLHKFELGEGAPKYVAAGRVDGWILDQWSMSEYDGHLRVASTDTDWWWGTGEDEDEGGNHVTILEDDGQGHLTEVGAVRDIAPGERITGVRMMGDIGYVVTFEWIDPLWTIDLSDPTDPKVLGELELPGFSTYLHPMGDDHLLAVGFAGDMEGNIDGLAVNVFDVSDLSAPTLAHQYTLESDDWSYSEAIWDHHAFTYHRDVLSLPIYTYDYDDQTGDWQGFSGMLVLEATPEGITELGRVDHEDLIAESECYYEWEGACQDYWYASMRRSIYIEDNLFSISNYGMKVNELTAPENELARVLYHPLD